MTADTTDRDLTFTIRAIDDPGGADGKPVPADVFVRKMQEILEALREADRAANSGARHEYLITNLKKGSAEVTFGERALPAFQDVPIASSLLEFEECVEAVYTNDVAAAARYNGLVDRILKVATGAGDRFAFIEIGDKARSRRADRIFFDQAKRISEEIKHIAAKKPARLFRGKAFEGFDGSIKEVDLRSKNAPPKCKLVLSDGTRELDCDFIGFTLDEIREHLDCRVWAEGEAIYNGESGMPVRLQITKLRKIQPNWHPSRWRGSIEMIERDDWFE